jgi:hypothetical protein
MQRHRLPQRRQRRLRLPGGGQRLAEVAQADRVVRPQLQRGAQRLDRRAELPGLGQRRAAIGRKIGAVRHRRHGAGGVRQGGGRVAPLAGGDAEQVLGIRMVGREAQRPAVMALRA